VAVVYGKCVRIQSFRSIRFGVWKSAVASLLVTKERELLKLQHAPSHLRAATPRKWESGGRVAFEGLTDGAQPGVQGVSSHTASSRSPPIAAATRHAGMVYAGDVSWICGDRLTWEDDAVAKVGCLLDLK
jgi:hypothetical protein